MAVYVSNLTVNGGTDFGQIFTLQSSSSNSALNLTGYTVRAEMRKHPNATGVTTFTCSIYDAANGKVRIGLTSTSTASLKDGRYVYDVVITDTGNAMTRVVEGMVLVRQGVTR
jgi:hypothetical protein